MATESRPAEYADEQACAECHHEQVRLWTGSHHDRAMDLPTEATVLGNFPGSFSVPSAQARFERRENQFRVETEGPGGRVREFVVDLVLGVYPLQQYVVDLGGGRKQALPFAWDTAGQAWFHLYPNEATDPANALHWTRRSQNWNHMCGECHSTGFKKAYSAEDRSYTTITSRLDVGCQACHGPVGDHAARARLAKGGAAAAVGTAPIALSRLDTVAQAELCARCHARRATIVDDSLPTDPLLDSHIPELLSENLYHPDGQVQDEVYEYGSFLQSKMYAQGVRCSDCHDPHSSKLRRPGDSLCTGCHGPQAPQVGPQIRAQGLQSKLYDASTHHHHAPGSEGSRCIGCHAPSTTFMRLDQRHDHSFRIPRPDMTLRLGTPNPCANCHADRGAAWAAEQVSAWRGEAPARPHFAVALDAGRRAQPGAVRGLTSLIEDRSVPSIVRATAAELLGSYPGERSIEALRAVLSDSDPGIRRAAATALGRLGPEAFVSELDSLLSDSRRAVRFAAVQSLAATRGTLESSQLRRYAQGRLELEAALTRNLDVPETLSLLALLRDAEGLREEAIKLERQALDLDPLHIAGYVNLADRYREREDEQGAEEVLRTGLRAAPGSAPLHNALGLLLVRTGRKASALAEFRTANSAAPNEPRYAYVLGIALADAGQGAEALGLLERSARSHGNRDVNLALASLSARQGDLAGARAALLRLQSINPSDPALSNRSLAEKAN